MKKYLSLMVLGLSLVGAAPAMARSPMPPILRAEFIRMQLDPQLAFSGPAATGGEVNIDLLHSQVRFTVVFHPHCEPGRLCTHFVRAPLMLNLKLVGSTVDPCNTRVYTAMSDQRPVDGQLARLVIKDHTQDKCQYMRAFAPTEMVLETRAYSRSAGHEIRTYSTIEANRLEPDYTDVIR